MSQKPKKKNKPSSGGGSVALAVLLTLVLALVLGGVSYGVYRLLYRPAGRLTPATDVPAAATAAPAEPTAAALFTPEPTPLHVHLWREATCTEPRTCQSCGMTEGEPLGHDATKADYWSPGICLRCREEISPMLTPDFELRELAVNVGQGVAMGYTTVCANDPNQVTVGQATVKRYTVTRSSNRIASIPGKNWVLPEKEGFEWRLAELEIVFNDYNAQYYGFNIKESLEDYYVIPDHGVRADFAAAMPTPDPEATPSPSPNPLQIVTEEHNNASHSYSDDVQWVEESNWYESNFIVEYKGGTYICTRVYDGALSGWENGTNTFHYAMAVQVPQGYDGCVLCLYNARHGTPGTDWNRIYEIADENTLFFRLA